MGPDEICQKWRENKCYEFRKGWLTGDWYCGSKGIHRPHVNIRHDWSPASMTAFRFTISASERLNMALAMYGKEVAPVPLPNWRIPAMADEEKVTVGQINDFVSHRLVRTIYYACGIVSHSSIFVSSASVWSLFRSLNQRHFHIENEVEPYIAVTGHTIRPSRDNLMGLYRQHLDMEMNPHFDLKYDFVGNQVIHTAGLGDGKCPICSEDIPRAEQWLYPCKRHMIHLHCFAEQSANNKSRHIRHFFIAENPAFAEMGCYTVSESDPIKDTCYVCGDSLTIDYTKGPILTAVDPSKQYLFSELNYPPAENWFYCPYGMTVEGFDESEELNDTCQAYLDSNTVHTPDPVWLY